MSHYLIALTVTILVEMVVIAGWTRFFRSSLDSLDTMMFVMGLNLITHPLAWSAWSFFGVDFWTVELVVVVFEAIGLSLIPGFSFRASILISVVINAASLSTGLALSVWLI